jgi:hypothetical protein
MIYRIWYHCHLNLFISKIFSILLPKLFIPGNILDDKLNYFIIPALINSIPNIWKVFIKHLSPIIQISMSIILDFSFWAIFYKYFQSHYLYLGGELFLKSVLTSLHPYGNSSKQWITFSENSDLSAAFGPIMYQTVQQLKKFRLWRFKFLVSGDKIKTLNSN